MGYGFVDGDLGVSFLLQKHFVFANGFSDFDEERVS